MRAMRNVLFLGSVLSLAACGADGEKDSVMQPEEIGQTGAALKTTVGADAQITIAGNASLDTAKDLTVRAGQNFLLQSAGVARLTTGLDAVIQTGRSFVTSSAAMFEFVATETGTFKTGNASYLSKKDGTINIVGRDIAITGNGTTTVRSAGELFLKGSKILQN